MRTKKARASALQESKPVARRRRDRTDPLVAVACIRVSTDEARQELGAKAQRAAIEKWAQKEGVSIVSWHLDEASGGAPIDKRLGLLDALAALETTGAGKLVFQKVDRFSRDSLTAAIVQQRLQKIGVALAFADGLGAGEEPAEVFMRDILLSTSKFEKAIIRARIRAGLAVKKERGEMTGKPPYGWCCVPGPVRANKNGELKTIQILEEDEREQKVILLVRELAKKGVSVKDIIEALAGKGLLNRKGRPFHHPAIYKIIRGD